MQVWNQSPKAYLQGEDLHPLSRSLQKLLDIGNAIHPKHWIQIWPVTTSQTLSQQNLLSFRLA